MVCIRPTLALSLLVSIGRILALGPSPVNLRTAGNYAILAESGISTVPPSVITGNIAVSPAAGTFLTGFSSTPPTTFSTSAQVTGELFAANYLAPTPNTLTVAIGDLSTAYTDAKGRTSPNFLNLGAGSIGGLTLAPGLYNWGASLDIPTSITISGAANDTWIFQVAGTLTMAANKQVILAGGALASNIVWQVSGVVAIGTSAHFEGVILAATSVVLNTGATMNGRILVQTSVALQSATVDGSGV